MIVSVNKYTLAEEDDVDVLDIDNNAVRESQVAALAKIRASRDEAAVEDALEAIYQCACGGEGNLLDLAVKATRLRATVGEISFAMEREFGRFNAQSQTVSGVYGSAYQDDENWQGISKDIEDFAEKHGRRPRMLVCKMGQDGHDRCAN